MKLKGRCAIVTGANQGLGFEALIPLCRGLRDKIIAQAENKLFLL